MERDCNKCVYSTRDGNCRKWECNGTVTVEDIRKEATKEFAEWLDKRDIVVIPEKDYGEYEPSTLCIADLLLAYNEGR